MPFVNGFNLPHPWVPLEPGVYCVGATMLEHVYSPIRGPVDRRSWKRNTSSCASWSRRCDVYFTIRASAPEMDRVAAPEKWRRAATRHDLLRFARLCHYLRVRTPDANIGYSIFIYRLDAAEIAAATTGSLADWQALITRTAARGSR